MPGVDNLNNDLTEEADRDAEFDDDAEELEDDDVSTDEAREPMIIEVTIKWDDAAIPWRNMDSTVKDIYLAEDCQSYQPVEQEIDDFY